MFDWVLVDLMFEVFTVQSTVKIFPRKQKELNPYISMIGCFKITPINVFVVRILLL